MTSVHPCGVVQKAGRPPDKSMDLRCRVRGNAHAGIRFLCETEHFIRALRPLISGLRPLIRKESHGDKGSP